ncbi:hypothetical protein A2767_00925 [Candidatus Roizmanbacteria bacterium RIFCSPHIGHO2_01_FULL_35_10]|uniref:Glycosyltransferase RgtA/B/C/D-like domain-containing protein n=1 Tax=Candidatus Roizmanbacteria bacterium RIFCSPLOWO2_01_FULL_35_13 TaxID=1802055 RepID=A0A1F7IB00_9BACT|nr:MAG: hypothetical protein A2767_00925 [Candidatus Roizmanbacteria bacterium RIFCSPHIGHO2_01_FULL_35_10]OGK40533.1 MAG: hypothetical protein A3A74_03000 [Candidatus Roizmanbacteria bacterium RIFCSPLOWO2_01_FULL_35_13]
MQKIKSIFFILSIALLVYTRFVGLDWGLPYPMHPDERNTANAIQQLQCDWPSVFSNRFSVNECLNPHFFAYGQFPLYLGYGIVYLLKFFDGDLTTPISFQEAAFSLRIISALASILNVFVLIKLTSVILIRQSAEKNPAQRKTLSLDPSVAPLPQDDVWWKIPILLILIYSPFFIQFSHFGTTESLLMFLFSIIIYLSLKFWQNKLSPTNFYVLTAIFSGMAIATKVSSVLFLIIPLALIFDKNKEDFFRKIISISYLLCLTLIFCILFSPHNFISFPQFLGAMKYESDVALGTYRAFYTRQFENAEPVIFQFLKIFPYSLGWPVFIFSILGFIFLPFKKEFNIIRLAILAGFIPNAFMYAKWTRFVSPILPLMLIMAVLFLDKLFFLIERYLILDNRYSEKAKQFIRFLITNIQFLITIILIIPGFAFLSIYQNPDVRFTATDWVYKNIPDNSYVLSETANVVDIPITNPKSNPPAGGQNPNYQYISFNFYDLDENPELPLQLQEHIAKADYIFIPSRRIFANHYCPKDELWTIVKSELNFNITNSNDQEKCQYFRVKYPLLNNYYDRLFSGELGFTKVAEFNEFPKIQLLGQTILEFPDEEAEETWTVFDHPVFRIYKKLDSSLRSE